MAERWKTGECPAAEVFLAQHLELRLHPEAAIDLIYEEICQRQDHGQDVNEEEILRRFPEWRVQLEILLHCDRILESGLPAPQFPAAGETLGDFHLVAELGRGALGRVFLATQPALADRQVVLKLTPCDGREHLSLARLQHTNIVPLYSVQDDPSRHLRLLCMPYFGGITLARLLEVLRSWPVEQRTGQLIVQALDQKPASGGCKPPEHAPSTLPAKGPARLFLAQLETDHIGRMAGIERCLLGRPDHIVRRRHHGCDVADLGRVIEDTAKRNNLGHALSLKIPLDFEPIQLDGFHLADASFFARDGHLLFHRRNAFNIRK